MSDSNLKNEPTKKGRGWLLPAVDVRTIRSGLYLVATPIGNMGDMSFRALDVLAQADLVACEDTRVSGKLLKYYDISAKLMSYNDHSDAGKRSEIFEAVEAGKVVALISDAGMPLISDPGYKLVCEAQERGIYVSSVPGANAPLMALQLSGLPSDSFAFIGFLPTKQGARQSLLKKWEAVPTTLIAFETAPRLVKALVDIQSVLGERLVCVTRELTKMYEEARKGSASELISHYEEHGAPKGEIVLVISPPEETELSEDDLRAALREALETMGTKDAAAHVSAQTGTAKKVLYAMALEIAKDG